jgi:flagellar motility protein MotE (MotC chaperone)
MAEKKTGNNKLETSEEGKKSKGKGGCLIVLLILFLTPLLALGALYFLNKDFNLNVNGIMSNMPGPVGTYFEKYPTRAEELEQIRTVSAFMLDLEESRAVDKLLILKKDDTRAYDDVIKDMLRINPNKTKSILEGIRQATINKDALSNTVQGISDEQTEDLKAKAAYISSLSFNAAVGEVEAIIEDSINGHKNAAAIFEYIDDVKAVGILYQLDQLDRERILAALTDKKALAIRNVYSSQQRRISDLVQIADVYDSEDPTTLIETIGNTTTYSIDDLAVIYKNLGPKKAGEVLAKSVDEAFVFELVAKIKANELLVKNEDLITPDLLKALKIYREFDDNVVELIDVYSKMDLGKVVEIVKNMLLNASPSKVYELNNGEFITISDEDLILEILTSFPQDKIAAILSSLDQTLSSELTRKLVLPKN